MTEELLIAVRVVWLLGTLTGLPVIFWRLYEALADLHVVRLRRLTNGRLYVARSGVFYDVAFVLLFAGQFVSAASLLIGPSGQATEHNLPYLIGRSALLALGAWVTLLALVYGAWTRIQIRRALERREP